MTLIDNNDGAARLDQLQREKVDWETRAVRAEANVAELTRMNGVLRSDISIICDEVHEEAISRDWCDDYGHFVDKVNDRLSTPHLQHCSFTHTGTWMVTVQFTCTSRSADDEAGEIYSYLESIEVGGGTVENVDVETRSFNRG